MERVVNILVTGSNGFIGKNLCVSLKRRSDIFVNEFDTHSDPQRLNQQLSESDVIFHLAGVNRPKNPDEFKKGNIELSRYICDFLRKSGKKPLIIFSSSIQAILDNPYGISKKIAEDEFFRLKKECGVPIAVFRLPGVFGKWCRPNYNSVVATFCHNISHNLAIDISDPKNEIQLVYIDDVVRCLVEVMEGDITLPQKDFYEIKPSYQLTLGKLANTLYFFRDSRESLQLADFSDRFKKCLYATYLSYLSRDNFSYPLEQRIDKRGELAELIKSQSMGQIFVSRTRPGVTRGDHYHDTKVEKFVVLDGESIIRFRHITNHEVIEYNISGRDFKVVDIPPGYTHSIENIGKNDLIVLFWANEIFNPSLPDTFFDTVVQE